jgi:hypothetical protein
MAFNLNGTQQKLLTLGVIMLSFAFLIVILSIVTCHHAGCRYAKGATALSTTALSIMTSYLTINKSRHSGKWQIVFYLSVVYVAKNTFMLSVIMLNIIILYVFTLRVMVPS